MSISEKEIKKLWGLAAGICSYPGCDTDCIPFINEDDPTIIGEMAHIIAKKPNGPRGIEDGGDDTYENLILLCPTHHRLIDKAKKGTFTEEMLIQWKYEHENKIREVFLLKKYSNKVEMAKAIKRLLIENYRIWLNFGPESVGALNNPLSNLYKIWGLRKLSTIIPNNRKIINIIKAHEDLFELEDLDNCFEFIEHAEVFENSCYSRIEGAKRFPKEFEEVINKYAEV